MSDDQHSLQPGSQRNRSLRRQLGLTGEFVLALLPTLTVVLVLVLVERLSNQRLLFASLASSAFLIYLDPQHGTNSVRTLVMAQTGAALIGLITFMGLGPGYGAAAGAMVLTIILMILLDAVHPPAVSTALSFAFRAGQEQNLVLFGLALAMVVVLIGLQRSALWLLRRIAQH